MSGDGDRLFHAHTLAALGVVEDMMRMRNPMLPGFRHVCDNDDHDDCYCEDLYDREVSLRIALAKDAEPEPRGAEEC